MTWDGINRRRGTDRRVVERRRTMRYNIFNLLVIDGITWIDSEAANRRQRIRRREDREKLARRITLYSSP